jgi:hypothetical protein
MQASTAERSEIAWYIRAGVALICLTVSFAVAIGAVNVVYKVREEDRVDRTTRASSAAAGRGL